MSVFNSAETPAFPFADPDAVTKEALIGEGKKYADEAALIKAFAHSQNHIVSVEKTAAELREELKVRLTVEEALKKAHNPTTTPAPSTTTTPVVPSVAPVSTSQEVISGKALSVEDVTRLMTEREETTRKTQNLTTAVNTLNSITGSDANTAVLLQKKSQETGIDLSELEALAGKSPDAFFRVLGVEIPKVKPTGSLNTYTKPVVERAPDASRLETLEDFAALRKSDLSSYFSPKNQKKMMELALKGS